MPNIKLTDEQRENVYLSMKHHQSLIKQKRYKDARAVSPSVIAYENNISRSHAYNIFNATEKAND